MEGKCLKSNNLISSSTPRRIWHRAMYMNKILREACNLKYNLRTERYPKLDKYVDCLKEEMLKEENKLIETAPPTYLSEKEIEANFEGFEKVTKKIKAFTEYEYEIYDLEKAEKTLENFSKEERGIISKEYFDETVICDNKISEDAEKVFKNRKIRK